MDIQVACIASAKDTYQTEFSFDLPWGLEADASTEDVTMFSSSDDYVTEAPSSSDYLPEGVECSQSFSYTMVDESTNPSLLTIDADTGVLSLTNNGNEKQSYAIYVNAATTDGYNMDTQLIPVSIDTVCGPLSTEILMPTSATEGLMADLYKAPFTTPVL